MTATVTDLQKWREEHPPLARLFTAQLRTFDAWMRYNSILMRAWFRELGEK